MEVSAILQHKIDSAQGRIGGRMNAVRLPGAVFAEKLSAAMGGAGLGGTNRSAALPAVWGGTLLADEAGHTGTMQGDTAYAGIIAAAAESTGLPQDLIRAVIRAESSFDANAVSSAGAQGLMQLMPGTAAELGVTDSFDPAQNVAGGAAYLKKQLDRFGDIRLALAAYNMGPGKVTRLEILDPNDAGEYNKIPERVRNYVDKVLAGWTAYQGA